MENRIREFIARKFLKGKKGIADGDSLFSNNVIDSFGVLELVAFIEREFSVSLNPTDVTIENFDSIAGIAALIRKKRGGS